MNELVQSITRADVIAFEGLIKAHPAHLTASDFVTKHHFAMGCYIRELHIPKGMITVGKIHKHPHIAMLVRGKRRMIINGKMDLVSAVRVWESPAGMKQASETLEDSIFMTVHPTDKTDIAEIERDLVCDSEEEYREFLAGSLKCLS